MNKLDVNNYSFAHL